MSFDVFVISVMAVFAVGIFVGVFWMYSPLKRPQADALPKCSCDDPAHCEIWCYAKERFTQDTCPHPARHIRIRNQEGTACTCERIVIQCTLCGITLHEEIDC